MTGQINTFSEKVTELGNTGFRKQVENKLGAIVGMVVCNSKDEFATATSALTLADWNTKFKLPKNSRLFMFPLFDAITDKSGEDTYSDGLQGQKFNSEGLKSFEAMVDVNNALANKLRSFNGKDTYIYFIDESGSLIGYTPDDTKFAAIKCSLRVGSKKLAGKGEKMMVPLNVTIKNANEWGEDSAVIEPINETPFWNPKTDFDGVYDCVLVGSSYAGTGFKVQVYKQSINPDVDTSAVSGLVKEDFVLKSAAGVVKTITSLTESEIAGTYDLVATVVNTDTLELDVCANISLTDIAIEGTNKLTVTGIV